MKLSKVILLSTVCSFGYTADCSYATYKASESSFLISTSGIHTYHTQHPTDETPALPSAHPRGVAESSPRFVPSAESAMLTLCLPEESNRHIRVASVCFITDTRACSGEKFSNDETPGNGSGNPGGIPDYDTPQEQCQAAGYGVTSCPAGSHGDNPCPADSSYYQKCVCDANMTQTCTKPYYGVGPSCDGKYASCELDNQRACKEDGYTNTCPAGQKLKKSPRCPYDNSYGICCTESCPNNSSTTCTGANTGDDGCGYACYKCCVTSCPVGYDYTESQLTGASGSGWVKDGNDYCDHCTRGRLYKRKPATCPSSANQTCGCGGSNPCKSGNNTYYSSCNCCSNCSGYSLTSQNGCSYGYNSCRDQCTGTTYYQCKSCDDSCSGYTSVSAASRNCSKGYDTGTTQCGNPCYTCRSCSGSSHYWNANGSHQIPYGTACWHGYGDNANITAAGSTTYESVLIRFHSGATVDFPITVNGDLTIGYFDCHYGDRFTGNVTFNGHVTINGTLVKQRGSVINFNSGVSGSYSIKCIDCGWREVSC